MTRARSHRRLDRRGGIYPLVLIVAGAAASASLAGLAMRRAAADRQTLSANLAEARVVARSAIECGVQLIAETENWRSKFGVDESWSGSIGDHTVVVSVTDETDSDLDNDDTDPFTITATATVGGARATARATATLRPDTEYRGRVLALDPVGYWPLDDASGTRTAARLAGDTNGGYSTPFVSDRETGYDALPAPLFDTTGTVAFVPHHAALLLDDGTVMCHFYVDEDRFFDHQTILAKDIRGDDGPGSLRLYISNPGVTLRVRLESESGTVDEALKSVTLDEWHHIAVTFGRKGLRICLNGQEVFKDTDFDTGLGPNAGDSGNTHNLTAGLWYDGDSFEDPLMGSVRDIVFIDRQLSHREVEELLYNKENAFCIEPDAWEWIVQ